MSLVLEAIKNYSCANGGTAALTDGKNSLGYAELNSAINNAGIFQSYSGSCVAVDVNNGIAWALLDLIFIKHKITSLPLPPFFTKQQREHAISDSAAQAIISDKPQGFETAQEIELAGRKLYLYKLVQHHKKLPKNTAKITYTSGTTGHPKGICLSQGNMEQVALSLVEAIGNAPAKRSFAILPLSVLLENIAGLYSSLLAGGCYIVKPLEDIGFAQNFRPNFLALIGELKREKATSCILVPELSKGLVFTLAGAGLTLPDIKFIAVGGAKLSTSLLHEAEKLKLPVYQGYGLSESASVVAVNTPGANKIGSVGKILPHIKYSIANDGEIILHNPAMLNFSSADHYTGDIGIVDAEGYLHITGRKKNVIINSFGRNINPEWVEGELTSSIYIAQAYVYGDGEPSLSAIIVPSSANALLAEIDKSVKQVNSLLPEYAQVRSWALSAPFTVENGMLTGTGRLKRKTINDFYKLKPENEYAIL